MRVLSDQKDVVGFLIRVQRHHAHQLALLGIAEQPNGSFIARNHIERIEIAEEDRFDLVARLHASEPAVLRPLEMLATTEAGATVRQLAYNEVSLLRAGPQAAKLRISVDGKVRLDELVCDGALVSTPAGSTAYNYSAHGPILPIGSEVLALTPMAAFRPRRWRGALATCRCCMSVAGMTKCF